jgi:hypothetical protein
MTDDDKTFLYGNIIGYTGIAERLAGLPEYLWLPVYLIGLVMALTVIWRDYVTWLKAMMETM